jgi:hypothetical protein
MNKMNKLGVAVLAVTGSMASQAGTFAISASESVGVEAATSGSLTANFANTAIQLTTGTAYAANDRLVISLTNGATFADESYRLVQSGSDDLTEFLLTTAVTAGASSIEFRAASAIADGADFLLVGSDADDVAATSTPNIMVAAQSAGTKVQIDAEARDVIGVYDNFTAAEVLRYANEFSANVDTVANEEIDVNTGRTRFGTLATEINDEIALEFSEASIDNGIIAGTGDFFKVTLSGDMTGIDSITAEAPAGTSQGTAVIDVDAGTAIFNFEASDIDGAATGASAILSIDVDNETVLATRTFTVAGELILASEDDKVLLASGTAAGEWTINGLQAKVSHLSLNTSSFVSWLKVMNTGTLAVEVYADIIYTLADGTEGSATAALLGSVDAGGVGTISEAKILEAIGNPTQLVDVHMTVTVTGEDNAVHLVAEKKASDGRISVPVYYDDGSATGRKWMQ